jgi:hypothetical protein
LEEHQWESAPDPAGNGNATSSFKAVRKCDWASLELQYPIARPACQPATSLNRSDININIFRNIRMSYGWKTKPQSDESLSSSIHVFADDFGAVLFQIDKDQMLSENVSLLINLQSRKPVTVRQIRSLGVMTIKTSHCDQICQTIHHQYLPNIYVRYQLFK